MEVEWLLEVDCKVCNGYGTKERQLLESDPFRACKCCHGAGTLITPEGKQLAEFLWKYYGLKPLPKIQRMDGEPINNPLLNCLLG